MLGALASFSSRTSCPSPGHAGDVSPFPSLLPMVSLCRIVSPFLPSSPQQHLLSFPFCPRRSHNITKLPLFGRSRFSKLVSSSTPSSSMETPPEGYRRNVGICLTNPCKNKIFNASRLDIPGAWQMPQGGVDEGEDPKHAAIRELREETGVASAEVIAEVPYWLTYDFPPDVKEKINSSWGSNWKGQAQKWFLLRLTGNEDEINLLGDGREKAEFGEWSWMTPQQAVDFKKPIYEEVLKVFAPHLQSDSDEQV
ncbi:nudix hydrolase 26, chloroplastic isoform X2 [Magnolia sinica]|uniref:nudix hydrolase 26, chloroplastic isoform X2 n=1 Tax=Magnolia sinica TaxID=86752 RepID=UPI0026585649|nr:nudix hydrolase 26, chloroplastic isoform X2 [Magnolia sinica]